MAQYRLQCDLPGDREVNDGQVLGGENPLEVVGGEAVVESQDVARDLARRHTHLEYDGPVKESGGADDEGAPDLSGKEWQSVAAAYDFEDVNGQSSADDITAAYADLSDEEQAAALKALDD